MKKIISLALAVLMLAGYCTAFATDAEDSLTITVGSATATKGGSVDIDISIADNPGIVAAILDVEYDTNALELTAVSDAGLLNEATHSENMALYPYQLTWGDDLGENNTANGKVVTLTFALKAAAVCGDYAIDVSVNEELDGIYNKEMEPIGATVVGGKITLGHSWNAGVITTQPTTTTPGVKTYTCTICGETRTEEVPVIAENPKGSCGETATWELDLATGTFTVSGTGDMTSFTAYADRPWHNDRKLVTTLKIAKGITSIGDYAFCYFDNLTSVEFEEGSELYSIGLNAFSSLKSLESIVLPDTVENYGYGALAYGTKLTSIQLSENAKAINVNALRGANANLVLNVARGSYAETWAINNNYNYVTRTPNKAVVEFEGAFGADGTLTWELYTDGVLKVLGEGDVPSFTSIKDTPWYAYKDTIRKVFIGKNVYKLGQNAFAHLYKLRNIEFEEGSQLVEIGINTFCYAQLVENVVIPDSVEAIGYGAFSYCKRLKTVQIPENGKTAKLNSNAFINSYTGLKLNVARATESEAWAIKWGFMYTTREPYTAVLMYSGTFGADNALTWGLYSDGALKITGEGDVPSFASIKDTPWYAYKDEVRKVFIGKNIYTLGQNAFAHLYKLRNIEFEEGSQLVEIGINTFCYAQLVENVVIPDSVEAIGYGAFSYCKRLKTIQIPESGKTAKLNSNAFISSYAGLELNVARATESEAWAIKWGFAHTLREPNVAVVVYSGTFGEGDALTWELYSDGALKITGEGDVPSFTSIKDTPWYVYKDEVRKVIIGKNIYKLGQNAFAHLYKLRNIEFEEESQLVEIGINTFCYALLVESVVIPDSVEAIGYGAFSYCKRLTFAQIPESGKMQQLNGNMFINSNSEIKLNVARATDSEAWAAKFKFTYTLREPNVAVLLYSGTFGEGNALTWELYSDGKLKVTGNGTTPDYSTIKDTPWYEYKDTVKKLFVGNGITKIGQSTFAHLYKLRSIEFESGIQLTEFATNAFNTCPMLESVDMPDSVRTVGWGAFANCSRLKSIRVSANASSINASAFTNHNADLVLSVVGGSYAHDFAEKNGFVYTTRAK